MTATMKALRAHVRSRTKCTEAQAKTAVDAVVGAIVELLAEQDTVSVSELGSFRVHISPARTARNPNTGDEVPVAACYRVSFKPSSALFQGINKTRELP